MSKLIVDNCVINQDIKGILLKLKSTIDNSKLKRIDSPKGDNVRVTCPVHKNGLEDKPSCDIYIGNSDKVIWGTTHCFACGFKGQLYDFVAEAADQTVAWAKKWLIDNFTEQVIDNADIAIDEPINLNNKKASSKSLSENVLSRFQSWHPYMQKRKLSRDVCKKFEVKYDPETECIVFPVRDISGKLKLLTRRSVNSKKFIIDKNIEKEVYLLDNIIKNNITKLILD